MPDLYHRHQESELASMRTLIQMTCLAVCLTPSWAKTTLKVSVFRQPCTIFIAGPGTVVSVHFLNIPFVEAHYVVKYRTDDGELIEVWHAGKDLPLREGMHGMLTYSTHPEMVRSFRVVMRLPLK
jgi:hypothetical protein